MPQHSTADLKRRQAFLRKTAEDLRLVKTDQALRKQRTQLYYAIDFSAIYSYAYRTHNKAFFSDLLIESANGSSMHPQSSDDRKYARFQATLDLLFAPASSHKLLLIPPYALELADHVNGQLQPAPGNRRRSQSGHFECDGRLVLVVADSESKNSDVIRGDDAELNFNFTVLHVVKPE